MHLNFTKKKSIIPDVPIKVHKKNETKDSKFQCHFHLPGSKNNNTKGEQSASKICISTHRLKQLPQYTKENKNRINKKLNDH